MSLKCSVDLCVIFCIYPSSSIVLRQKDFSFTRVRGFSPKFSQPVSELILHDIWPAPPLII